MYSRKDTGPNYIEFEKCQQVYLCEKDGEALSAIRNTFIRDSGNFGLVTIFELTSGKESTMDQDLDNCNKMYDMATYNRKQACVTIKKYNVNKPPTIRIVSALQKRMKQ